MTVIGQCGPRQSAARLLLTSSAERRISFPSTSTNTFSGSSIVRFPRRMIPGDGSEGARCTMSPGFTFRLVRSIVWLTKVKIGSEQEHVAAVAAINDYYFNISVCMNKSSPGLNFPRRRATDRASTVFVLGGKTGQRPPFLLSCERHANCSSLLASAARLLFQLPEIDLL